MNREGRQRIHFFKMTGTGNDFILIDNRKRIIDADQCQDFVKSACRRKVSVGADGLILIENDSDADFRWRFFNADGSEAEMCGNGARCASRFAYLTGIVENPRMAFRTLAGIIKAELLDTKVKVQVTAPHSLQMDIALEAGGRRFNLDSINTGVPHAVCFVKDARELEAVKIQPWGHAIRFHPQFQPAGTNANFVYIQNSHRIIVRTYERGVEGETLACGTGCVASVLVLAARGRVESPVEVEVRSGEVLTVYFSSESEPGTAGAGLFKEVCLEGDALVVYEADLWHETV
jgi:diaminopimelate epimerase